MNANAIVHSMKLVWYIYICNMHGSMSLLSVKAALLMWAALGGKKDNLGNVPGISFVPDGEGIRQLVFQLFASRLSS